MAVRRRHLIRIRVRGVIAALTLVGHLFAVIGLPLPAVRSSPVSIDTVVYPCENRGCGCVSAEDCWKGDCCWFTLEEKLAWADERGIEPPEHVRPMVKARKNRSASCTTKSDCCAKETEHSASAADCPECRRNNKSAGDRDCKSTLLALGIGPMVAKCHGLGAAPGVAFPPATVPDCGCWAINPPHCIGTILVTSLNAISSEFSPPTPPPKPERSSL